MENRRSLLPPSHRHKHEEMRAGLQETATRQRHFLEFPIEVRRLIYEYFVLDDAIAYQLGTNRYWYLRHCTGYKFSSLIRTCGQIHDELAPMIYKDLYLCRGNLSLLFEAGGSPHFIGSNIRYVKNVCIEYKTRYTQPTIRFPLKPMPFEREFPYDWVFPFVEGLELLYHHAYSLETVEIIVTRPAPLVEFLRPDGPYLDDDSDEAYEGLRRGFFPEMAFTLRRLQRFGRVKVIVIRDNGIEPLVDGLLPVFLAGQLGFELRARGPFMPGFPGGWLNRFELRNPGCKS